MVFPMHLKQSEVTPRHPFQAEVFSIIETAELLKISVSSVRRLIARGELRVNRKLRHLRIPRSELHQFLMIED